MRRRLNFTEFDEANQEVARLRASGYQRNGNWDLSQICEHLARALDGSREGFKVKAPLLMRIFAPLALRRVLRTRRIPAGVKIPQHRIPPPGQDESAAAQRLADAIASWQKHNADLWPHPFFGRLSRDRWREIHLIHMAHHLGFLEPVG